MCVLLNEKEASGARLSSCSTCKTRRKKLGARKVLFAKTASPTCTPALHDRHVSLSQEHMCIALGLRIRELTLRSVSGARVRGEESSR